MARKPLRATPTMGIAIPLDEALRNGDDNFIELYASGGGGGGAVDSVNGQTGVVVLDAADVGAATSSDIAAAVAALVDSSPGTLDTLNELAAALGDDPNFATTLASSIAGKQPLDSDLTAIAGLAASNDDLIQRKAGAWINRSVAQVKADLGNAATINGFAIPLGGTASLTQIGAAGGGANNFTGNQQIDAAEPRFLFNQTGAGTNLKLWDFDLASGVFSLRTRTDADGAGKNVLRVTRGATTAISDIKLGNLTDNPTGSWDSAGTFSFGYNVSVGNDLNAAGRITSASPDGISASQMLAIGATPRFFLYETGPGSDEHGWITTLNSKVLSYQTYNDAGSASSNYLAVTRGTGVAIIDIAFGNVTDNSPLNMLGTGLITAGGALRLANRTVAGLPSAATSGIGATAFVTDGSTTFILGFGLTVAGGGANKVPVYSDGTNWIVG